MESSSNRGARDRSSLSRAKPRRVGTDAAFALKEDTSVTLFQSYVDPYLIEAEELHRYRIHGGIGVIPYDEGLESYEYTKENSQLTRRKQAFQAYYRCPRRESTIENRY